jgi:multidrug efflux pump subunit AcrB
VKVEEHAGRATSIASTASAPSTSPRASRRLLARHGDRYCARHRGAELPSAAHIDFDGESREFLRAGRSLYVTFVLALVIVFLVLAAQFESFRHPLIIMFTVPLAVTARLLGLWLFDYTINVYSQIGVILLVGLAAKNGVLIVEFSNQLRDRGRRADRRGRRSVDDAACGPC